MIPYKNCVRDSHVRAIQNVVAKKKKMSSTTRIKVLEEQIDATKVEMTGDKRTLLCLSMALPEESAH